MLALLLATLLELTFDLGPTPLTTADDLRCAPVTEDLVPAVEALGTTKDFGRVLPPLLLALFELLFPSSFDPGGFDDELCLLDFFGVHFGAGSFLLLATFEDDLAFNFWSCHTIKMMDPTMIPMKTYNTTAMIIGTGEILVVAVEKRLS